MGDLSAARLRSLPQVDRLIERISSGVPHLFAAEAARGAIDEARAAILGGAEAPSIEELASRARLLLEMRERRLLRPVLNATGVLLHTNLGRAPLSREVLEAAAKLAAGYSNLEYDLVAGERGSRYEHSTALLRSLTGAESALVVNNNAAAVLLALAGLAKGREVLVSRGELIEIGGGFRIPEILAESGARLKEVGTTNRTHLEDYERAISGETGAVMKVHPSNYRVVGFTAEVPAPALIEFAHHRGLPLVHDLGSGLLRRRIAGRDPEWLRGEPAVGEALAEGADIVTFSGDKLLGGPQAGVILGRREGIEALHRSPLLRAFRVDKFTLAALDVTLGFYLEGREAELPLWSMALSAPAEIEARALEVAGTLAAVPAKVDLVDGFSTTGGGSAPGAGIPTVLLRVSHRSVSPDDLTRRLLDGDPPVVARIEDDAVIFDLRTILPAQDGMLAEALGRIVH